MLRMHEHEAPEVEQCASDQPDKGGRPSLYRNQYAAIAKSLCENGATDDDLAEVFRVSKQTIKNWRNQHPEFLSSTAIGKDAADDRVERALYERATGTTRKVVKPFLRADDLEPVYAEFEEEIPADVTAARLWLMNRRPEKWRDRTEVEHAIPENSPIAKMIAACSGTGFRPKED